eukprot:1139018-Pelagomonas_calceolata.AAC.1
MAGMVRFEKENWEREHIQLYREIVQLWEFMQTPPPAYKLREIKMPPESYMCFKNLQMNSNQRKNYVGRKTLPTSIKEKETHWLRRAVSLLHHKFKNRKG